MLTIAGKTVTREQVRGTVKLLRYYRRFLASPNHDRCASPEQFGIFYSKDEARQRLHFLVNTAINRKAGIPDTTPAERDEFIQLWRDSRRLRDIAARVRVYQFETDTARRRFGHLLSRYDD